MIVLVTGVRNVPGAGERVGSGRCVRPARSAGCTAWCRIGALGSLRTRRRGRKGPRPQPRMPTSTIRLAARVRARRRRGRTSTGRPILGPGSAVPRGNRSVWRHDGQKMRRTFVRDRSPNIALPYRALTPRKSSARTHVWARSPNIRWIPTSDARYRDAVIQEPPTGVSASSVKGRPLYTS